MTEDAYIEALFVHEDSLLLDVKADIVARGMPAISVPPLTGALLHWLVRISHSRRLLEIGALGGYSGIWLARALAPDGHLTSLELRPEYRDVALANLTRAGFASKVTYRVGPASESLKTLVTNSAQFDFFLIDADKENYPLYLDYVLKLATPGAIIAADNTLQEGRVVDDAHQDNRTLAIREYNRRVANTPTLRSLLIPVGDGLTVAQYTP